MHIAEACHRTETHMKAEYAAEMFRETRWIVLSCKAMGHFIDGKGEMYYVEITGNNSPFHIEITKRIQAYTLVY